MGLIILGAVYVFTAGLYLLITALAVGERARAFKGISPGILSPLSIIFGLLVGFLAAQVWSDADRASSAVNGEASALRSAVLLASGFPASPRRACVVSSGIHSGRGHPGMAGVARGNATLTIAPARLAEALRLALSLTPRGEGQIAAQREMVGSLQTALEARRQRIILSRSSINWVKWTVLLVQAGLTLLTIAMVHSDNRAANRIILAIFATGSGRGRADRSSQPPVHRGDLCAPHSPAPGDAGGRLGDH